MWILTHETWHMGRGEHSLTVKKCYEKNDVWHVNCDTWNVTHGEGCTFSLAQTVYDLRCFKDLEEKNELVKKLIKDGSVCRTAPATLSLLTMPGLNQL